MIDLPGTQIVMQRIALPADTKEALTEKGITPPDHVVLHLREATGREHEKFMQAQATGFPNDPATYDWVAGLMMRRAAEGTDPVVVREMLPDLQRSQITQFLFSYLSGEAVSDPKVVEQMAEVSKQQMTRTTLAVLGTLVLAGRSLNSFTTTPA